MNRLCMGFMLFTAHPHGGDGQGPRTVPLESASSGPNATKLVAGEGKGKVDTDHANGTEEQRGQKTEERVLQRCTTDDRVSLVSRPGAWPFVWLIAVCALACSLLVVGWVLYLTGVRRGSGLIAMSIGTALVFYLAYAGID